MAGIMRANEIENTGFRHSNIRLRLEFKSDSRIPMNSKNFFSFLDSNSETIELFNYCW